MNRQLTTVCLFGILLTSCQITKQRPDLGWFREVATPPQDDTVVVEEGGGLQGSATIAQQTAGPAATVQAPQPAVQQPVVAAPVTVGNKTHTVAKGDTLLGIARRYNCDSKALASVNGITNPNALKLGTVLRIPQSGAAAQAPVQIPAPVATAPTLPAPAYQTKQTNKKWWRFWEQDNPTAQQPQTTQNKKKWWRFWEQNNPTAKQPQTTQNKKKWWRFWEQNNPAAQRQQTRTMQPARPVQQQTATWQQPRAVQQAQYIVQPGDTFAGIARKHGLSMQSLLSANGLTLQQAGSLRIGQRIVIPAGQSKR